MKAFESASSRINPRNGGAIDLDEIRKLANMISIPAMGGQ